MCKQAASSATPPSKLRWPGERACTMCVGGQRGARPWPRPTAHRCRPTVLCNGHLCLPAPRQALLRTCCVCCRLTPRSGKLTSSSLDTYSCVALAGVATEWLRFGHAEGGLADVMQLDRLLQALRFTQVGPGAGSLVLSGVRVERAS